MSVLDLQTLQPSVSTNRPAIVSLTSSSSSCCDVKEEG
ncbi:class III lanthipeptide [Streptomyces sp. IBSBF 2435]